MGAIIAAVAIILVIVLIVVWRMTRAGEPTEAVRGRPADAEAEVEPLSDRDRH